MSKNTKTRRITYGRACRAYRTYGRRIHAQAERAYDRPVSDFESLAAYRQWRESLPINVRSVLTLFECDACMDADRSIG